jgi:hypothetical protein
MILCGDRLYLNRMWRNELTVARFFNEGQRHRRGHFLPVGFAGSREQGIEGCRQPGLIHLASR